MKKIIAFTLVLILLCCGLAGCETEADKIAAIAGHWETVNYYTSDSVSESLVNLDLYEEEIAMMDPGAIGIVDVIEFNEDKTYTITCNPEKSIAMVEEYFRNAFATFYQNRDQLAGCYTDDLSAMTEAEFQQFYADLYGQTNFDALIEMFVFSITDEDHLLQGTETGTYRIVGERIYFKTTGASEEEHITYSVNGDELTLNFANETEIYNKD